MTTPTIHPDILAAVNEVRVIDTHEHLEEEPQRLARYLDFVSLFEQYAVDDLRCAGMSEADWQRCTNPETPLDAKWHLFEPYYRRARNTGYIRAADVTIRDLFGIDELTAKTCVTLTERLQERNRPGVIKEVLQDRAGVDLALVNALDVTFFREKTDESLFRQDIGLMSLLAWPPPIQALEEATGVTVRGFRHYGQAIDALFEKYGPKADAVKQQSAYWRAQDFAKAADTDAKRVFEAGLLDAEGVSEPERKPLQDWCMHRCVRLATQYDLPIKIHTGYKAGLDYMDLEHVHPKRLTNLFIEYPKARFDLFHISYPYQEELIALCKHFHNVYADMCWAWIIDPLASRRFFKQFLTAVPSSKLVAFGGDYILAEPVYGHLRITRDQIALALSELVRDQWFTPRQAVELARGVLRENALDLFHIT